MQCFTDHELSGWGRELRHMKPSSFETRRAEPRMRACLRPLIASALVLSCLAAVPAFAQSGPDDNSHVRLDAPALMPKKPRAGMPDVKVQPLVWPRLDRGAVICRSESDLSRLAARRRGETVDGPVDCQIMRAATGISILQRQGPGMTEVQTNDPSAGGTGWTDAWLPDKPPTH
jgi:hypothetical protein